MSDTPTHIAGERLEVLAKGLALMQFDPQPNGMTRIRADLDDDTLAAWTSASAWRTAKGSALPGLMRSAP